MAGGIISNSDDSKKEFAGKITFYVVICGIIAATGGLMFGYDIGISGLSLYFDVLISFHFFCF